MLRDNLIIIFSALIIAIAKVYMAVEATRTRRAHEAMRKPFKKWIEQQNKTPDLFHSHLESLQAMAGLAAYGAKAYDAKEEAKRTKKGKAPKDAASAALTGTPVLDDDVLGIGDEIDAAIRNGAATAERRVSVQGPGDGTGNTIG